MAGLREGIEFELTAGGEALDTSGNDHPITISGPSLTEDRDGRPNSAYNFDSASNEALELDGLPGTLTSDTEGTITAWIKPDDAAPSGGKGIIGFGDNGAGSDLVFEIESTSGQLRGLCRNSGVQWIVDTTTAPLSDGEWAFVALVQDGTQPRIYVNGVELSTTNEDNTDLTYWHSQFSGSLDVCRIGAQQSGFGGAGNERNYFDGDIDDVRVYSRALSAVEIRRLFAEQFDDYYQFKDDVRVEMLLDGRSYDSSGKLYEGGGFGVYTLTDGLLGEDTARAFAGDTSDFIDLPSDVLTDSASDNEGAWEMWVRFDDLPSSTCCPMAIGDASEYTAIYIFITTGGLISAGAYLNGSGAAQNRFSYQTPSDQITPNLDEWMHIVLVQPNDAGGPNLYINGSEVTFNQTGSGTNNDIDFWISGDPDFDSYEIGRRNFFNLGGDIPFEDDISLVRTWSRALTATEIQYLYDLGRNGTVFLLKRNNQYASVSANGMVSRFDQTVYDTGTVYDSAGGNNATRNGGDIRRLPDGHYCSQLNGSSAYLEINDVGTDLASTTEGTWSIWARPHGSNGADQLIAFGDTDALEGIRLYYDVSSAEVFAQAVTGGISDWIINSNIEADTDRWMHIVLVHNGTRPDIYIDGVKAASTDIGSSDLTAWLGDYSGLDNGRIGSLNYNSLGEFGHFDGEVGEVIFFDRALGDDEIYQLYKDTYME